MLLLRLSMFHKALPGNLPERLCARRSLSARKTSNQVTSSTRCVSLITVVVISNLAGFNLQEDAIVAVLDADLQGQGTYCSHCLRSVEKDAAIRPESDRLGSVYCSTDCQTKAKSYSQGLLFTLESPLPASMAAEMSTAANEDRDRAQAAFAEYLKKTGKAAPELVARFIARQVSAETAKMMPAALRAATTVTAEPVLTDGGDYTLYDHLERLRYLEVTPPEEQTKLLKEVLQMALPGLEQFVTEERHATYLGGMAYNAFGVFYGNGRDDKVSDDVVHLAGMNLAAC